jgi:hypothetical protein
VRLSNAVAQGVFWDQRRLCDNRDKSLIKPNIVSRSKIMVKQHFSLIEQRLKVLAKTLSECVWTGATRRYHHQPSVAQPTVAMPGKFRGFWQLKRTGIGNALNAIYIKRKRRCRGSNRPRPTSPLALHGKLAGLPRLNRRHHTSHTVSNVTWATSLFVCLFVCLVG